MKRQHYRPFNPEQAQAGAPYGHIDDRVSVTIYEYFDTYCVAATKLDDGPWLGTSMDYDQCNLFMLPIATCQGKPVFLGDVLYDENGDKFEVEMSYHPDLLGRCTWEPARERVETRLTHGEFEDALGDNATYSEIANYAIQRAIDDGDVVPNHVVRAIYVFSMSLGEEGKFLAENILQAVGPAKAVILDNK